MKKGPYERELARRRREQKRRIRRFHQIALGIMLVVFVFVCFQIFSDKKKLRNEALRLYEAGSYEEALDKFQEAYEEKQWFADSINVDILMYEADCMLQLQLFTDAEAIYQTIQTEYSHAHYDKEQLQYMRTLSHALTNFHQGDYVSTVAAFTDAVTDGHMDISIYAAICYENQKNYDKMKEYLDVYAQYNGMDAYVYYKYASYYYEIKNYSEALRYLDLGIALQDTGYLQEILYAQIMCYKDMLNFTKAYELAASYIQRYPDDKKGQDLYAYLDTRVNLNETPIHDKFHLVTPPETVEE